MRERIVKFAGMIHGYLWSFTSHTKETLKITRSQGTLGLGHEVLHYSFKIEMK